MRTEKGKAHKPPPLTLNKEQMRLFCGSWCVWTGGPWAEGTLQGPTFFRPKSCQAPGIRTSLKNPGQQRAGMDIGPASLGNNSSACFLTSFGFALISPSCLHTHSLAAAPALAWHVMPGPQSSLLSLRINSESLRTMGGVNFPPGSWLEKSRLEEILQGDWLEEKQPGPCSPTLWPHPQTSLSRLLHSGLHPLIPLAFGCQYFITENKSHIMHNYPLSIVF